MPAPDQLTAVRARRIRAEADEIVLRDGWRRPTGGTTRRSVHVHDAYPMADMAEIIHDPECGRLPMIGLLSLAMLLILITIAAWLVLTTIDWQAVLDFIAPTAAQARDLGWTVIAEGL